MPNSLTADDLLAGASATCTIRVPVELLRVGDEVEGPYGGEVILRPLSVRDVQRISRAAREQHALTSVLMVQQALVVPRMTVDQVSELTAGMVQFLLDKINNLSGLALGEDDLERAVKAPVARVCYLLAREFGWTPAECSELTLGQVLLYVELLAREERAGGSG